MGVGGGSGSGGTCISGLLGQSMLAPPTQPAALVSLLPTLMWARRGSCLGTPIILQGPQPPSPEVIVALT